MKKFLSLVTLAVLLCSSAVAQNKFGYMNSLELLSLMPETATADSAIAKYAKELDELMNKMYTEYDTKANDAAVKKQKGLLTPEMEEVVVKELQDMEQRISEFQQNAEEKVGMKRQKLYDPILNKANEAIRTVAKANGYSYIFDTSAQAILFANDTDDVLPLVKKQLGIKDTPAPK